MQTILIDFQMKISEVGHVPVFTPPHFNNK